MMVQRFEIQLPFDPKEVWTDKAVAGLVGQIPLVNLPDGSASHGLVVAARKGSLGEVYITVETEVAEE